MGRKRNKKFFKSLPNQNSEGGLEDKLKAMVATMVLV